MQKEMPKSIQFISWGHLPAIHSSSLLFKEGYMCAWRGILVQDPLRGHSGRCPGFLLKPLHHAAGKSRDSLQSLYTNGHYSL